MVHLNPEQKKIVDKLARYAENKDSYTIEELLELDAKSDKLDSKIDKEIKSVRISLGDRILAVESFVLNDYKENLKEIQGKLEEVPEVTVTLKIV